MSIKDEFSSMNISRQRKWQLRRTAKGMCVQCGKPVLEGFVRCEKHHKKMLRSYEPVKRSEDTKFKRAKGKK